MCIHAIVADCSRGNAEIFLSRMGTTVLGA